MDPNLLWTVTRVDGKISAISDSFALFLKVASQVAALPYGQTSEVSCSKITTEELFALSANVRWSDLKLFGTPFQLNVWEHLFNLSRQGEEARLMSYSEFAERCGNRPGIRAVAHAVGLNPVAFVIPCHRIIPKESIDRIAEIEEAAQKTIFQGADLYLFDAVDFGQYALGKKMKRDLIAAEFAGW